MKDNATCTLTGAQWWKPYLGFLVLFLTLFIALEFAAIKMSLPEAQNIVSALLFIFVMVALLVVCMSAFTVVFCRIIYPTISVRNEAFSFTGSIGTFIKINLLGTLLSILSLGFYFPVYTKKITDYLAGNSVYCSEKASFEGKARKLLKYYLLALVLPLLIWFGLLIGLVTILTLSGEASSGTIITVGILALIVYLAIFFIILPFKYLTLKWYANIQWKDLHLTLKAQMWPAVLFLALQVFLTIITLGIYFPALYIKTYRYFIGKLVLETEGKEQAHLGFEGKTGSGFGLLWGQILLSIITIGIYLPWAYANCMRYFINNTFIEDTQVLINQ